MDYPIYIAVRLKTDGNSRLLGASHDIEQLLHYLPGSPEKAHIADEDLPFTVDGLLIDIITDLD